MLKRLTLNSPPYYILWWSAISFLLVAVMLREREIDIQLHDTYIVLTMLIVGLVFSAIVGVLGLFYWFLKRKKLSPWMTKTHVWLSLLSLFICLWIVVTQSIPELRQHSYSFELNTVGATAFLVFIGVQSLFVFNAIRSLFQ